MKASRMIGRRLGPSSWSFSAPMIHYGVRCGGLHRQPYLLSYLIGPAPAGGVARPDEFFPIVYLLPHLTPLLAPYSTFEENLKGSLEPGKFADLAVLSDDYLAVEEDEIKNIRPLLTMVGGKVVYRDPDYTFP